MKLITSSFGNEHKPNKVMFINHTDNYQICKELIYKFGVQHYFGILYVRKPSFWSIIDDNNFSINQTCHYKSNVAFLAGCNSNQIIKYINKEDGFKNLIFIDKIFRNEIKDFE